MWGRMKNTGNEKQQTIQGPSWVIDKEFEFDYGHRVHNQTLDTDYSIDGACVCRHLHGHRGKVRVYLSSDQLTRGVVTDYKHLNWLKNFLDQQIDHKFIIDINDPWFVNITNVSPVWDPANNEEPERALLGWIPKTQLNTGDRPTLDVEYVYFPDTEIFAGWKIKVDTLKGPEREFFEGFFITQFLPTSENLSRWIGQGVSWKMRELGVRCTRVDWIETPKSRATYFPNQ